MPLMETVTIINKSGKVVSTGKHLVNIFKDAKDAYNDKKAEIKAEHRQKLEFKQAQKLLAARGDDNRSVASSHRSHRSRRHKDNNGVSRPPLTERNLTEISEGSVTSSRRSRSHHGSRRGGGSRDGYRAPYAEDAVASQHPHLQRRHTDFQHQDSQLMQPLPPYASQMTRSASNPDLRNNHVDMNLAYGTPPPDLMLAERSPTGLEREAELEATMTKLDSLLLEAQCVQHSATAIIKNLQDNPEAMAAVALTLAELSNILTKMSPGILAAMKTSSPAIFALLASPQFLIAGGLALGVTVVMFGGYKIVKKIQADNAAKKEANRMEEALVWDANEMGSIESWRRGISAADGDGDEASHAGTSVDGEFITPEAARQKKERLKERRREERSSGWRGEERRAPSSVADSDRTIRKIGSESTIRRKDVSSRSKTASESGRSERTSKGKEVVVKSKEKKEKKSALSVIFSSKSGKSKKTKESESGRSHRPRMVEL